MRELDPTALRERLLGWAQREESWGALLHHDSQERVHTLLHRDVEVALEPGDTVTIAREAIHRVRHAGETPAVSLHAYSPRLRRVGTYEIAADGVLLRHPQPSDVTLGAASAA